MTQLKEILIKDNAFTAAEINKVEPHLGTGISLQAALLREYPNKEDVILKALEKQYSVPSVAVSKFTIDPKILNLIPKAMCEKHCVLPVQQAGTMLVVAFANPGLLQLREDLRYITKMRIQPVVSIDSSIITQIEKQYGQDLKKVHQDLMQSSGESEFDETDFANIQVIGGADNDGTDTPITKYVSVILLEAIRRKASDIHFEPYEKRMRVRYRVDGILIETIEPPPGTAAAIASRIKIMSKLDIAEKRRPQDGRLKVRTVKGREMDFRVSIFPTLWGEKVVLRLLDQSNLQLDMTKLGFEVEDLAIFKKCINLPQGMVLLTGPTGSGKTTTIYSALASLNTPDVNIATAEDPVEFNLEGINQGQMNSDIGLTFASALRSYLRQDPDIIMVGEIRDLETAEIAFKAASTGHLVVSTLHTNDAPSTVVRLTEMGIPPYIITSTVNLIVAQRLVGKTCSSCARPVTVDNKTLMDLGIPEEEIPDYIIKKGTGCAQCDHTGIKGRIAIYELMQMNLALREAIVNRVSTDELRKICRKENMRTLRRSALIKLKQGLISIEEVLYSSISDV